MEPLVRIRYMNGPMPFDRADSSGFGLVHTTGREYWDDFPGCWRTEYEDSWTVDYPVTDPMEEEEYEDDYDNDDEEEW